jgi:hypothetical protein
MNTSTPLSMPSAAPECSEPSARSSGSAFLGPVLATLAVHLSLLVAYLWPFGGDVSTLVCAPRERIGHWPYEALTAGFPTTGHDGQFYYLIARWPWHPPAEWFDSPALRHGRLLYPLLAWLLSGGGHPGLLLWTLPLINLAAIAGLSALGTHFALRHGRSPWWGFFLPLAVNVGAPALRNLTDPLSMFLNVGLLTASLTAAPAWHIAAWAFPNILCREQNLVLVAIVLGDAALRRRWGHALILALAILSGLGWSALMTTLHGRSADAISIFGPPLAGLLHRWLHLSGDLGTGRGAVPLHLAAIGQLTALLALCLVLPFLRASRATVLVAWAGAALAVFASPMVYGDGHSYTRVFAWMPLGVWLWTVESRRFWPAWILAPSAFWPCAAILQVWLTRGFAS